MAINFFKIARGLFLTPQTTTPASPADGDVYYDATSAAFQFRENGSWKALGSGQGGINYVTNGQADTGVVGWSSYADAAGPAPVDGTGGSPTITFAASPTLPLRGSASFLLSKPAANRQGQGVAYAFTIDAADRSKPLTISFDYQPTSGFVSGTGAASLSDVVVYVYDVTNARLIQPAPFVLAGGSLSPNRFTSSFQAASNSTSYRLIFHIASVSTVAYDLKFDNVSVGPKVELTGAPINDWASYIPAFVGFGSVSGVNVVQRRVGDSLEIQGTFTIGVTGPVVGTLQLPPGLAIDSTKFSGPTRTQSAGIWIREFTGSALPIFNGTSALSGALSFQTSDLTRLFFAHQVESAEFFLQNTNTIFSAGDVVHVNVRVPIQGWGSSVVMSQDTDTRVVAASASSADGGIAIGAALSNLPFATIELDTHGAYNPGTGAFAVPVAGIYSISGALFTAGVTAESSISVALQLNGITIRQDTSVEIVGGGGSSYNPVCRFDWLVDCKAGDLLQFYGTSTVATTLDTNTPNRSRINIARLSGPSVIAASETVVSSYSLNTTFSPAAGTPVVVPFDLKNIDTHGAYDVGTSRFTAPKAGIYAVSGALTSVDNNITYTLFRASLFKNGSQFRTIQTGKLSEVNTVAISAYLSYDFLVELKAGEYVDIRVTHNGGAGQFLINDTTSPIFGCYMDVRSL